MREVLHNILTRRNWFLGAVVVVIAIYALLNPKEFGQLVSQLFQMAAVIALCWTGIMVILGRRPWWLGGGGGGKKKGG